MLTSCDFGLGAAVPTLRCVSELIFQLDGSGIPLKF